jgi:hypothetical protein
MTAVEWLYTLSKQRELDKFDLEYAKQMEATQQIENVMKQTAVDWLVELINGKSFNKVTIDIPKELIEEANEMHKEQCVDLADEWEIRSKYFDMDSKEDLYDKIYKKQI